MASWEDALVFFMVPPGLPIRRAPSHRGYRTGRWGRRWGVPDWLCDRVAVGADLGDGVDDLAGVTLGQDGGALLAHVDYDVAILIGGGDREGHGEAVVDIGDGDGTGLGAGDASDEAGILVGLGLVGDKYSSLP